jgi:hypothetical protein
VTAHRRLASDAGAVLAVATHGQGPAAWYRTGFARRVDAARRQLAPISAPGLLAESFRREASVSTGQGRPVDAVRAAYAIRWLELETGRAVPPWHAWMVAAPSA